MYIVKFKAMFQINCIDLKHIVDFLKIYLYNVFYRDTLSIFLIWRGRRMYPVRILGIAPYPGLERIMQQLAAQRPEIQLITRIGNQLAGRAEQRPRLLV